MTLPVENNNWYYSPDHGQLCQVIEAQTLWGGDDLPSLAAYHGFHYSRHFN